jgi:GNAT superfamily N-acetyltransferase
MIRCRPLDWPRDRVALACLDTSVTTDVVYEVTAGTLGFALAERRVDPPLRKCYDVPWDELTAATLAVIAERDGDVAGVAAAEMHRWNRRMVISHLYVNHRARRSGVGTALVRAVRECAEPLGARCLWAETQNVNAPAIRFYRRQGFACCGLDTALYDPQQVPGEVAVFFALALGG